MKKFLSIILTCLMLMTMIPFTPLVFAAEEGNVVILYTNDVHCIIDDYPALAAYRAELISQGNTVITVDAGDAIQGEVVGTLTQGMLAYISQFYYKFIWREATARKSVRFSSLLKNSYLDFYFTYSYTESYYFTNTI